MVTRRVRWLAVLTTVGLVAASCADDDDDDGGGGGTESGELISYDESDLCGSEEYAGNLAALEAVDETTVRMTLCEPDPALPAKVAFATLAIHPSEHLADTEGDGNIVDNPIGTGPYMLEEGNWERGSQLVLTANPEYWDGAPTVPTVVFRWNEESAQRLVELQSGGADGIDNVGTEDYGAVEGDDALQLLPRDPLNIMYLGFNVDTAPFDNETLRQAVGYAIDRERLIENFYPEGAAPATQFQPPDMPGYEEGFEGYTYDPDRARELLAEAGYPNGVDLGPLSYRNAPRPYVPQPVQIVSDIRDQLADVGITVTPDEQESTELIDNANAGNLGFHLLGWNADFPDATNFWDYHFGAGGTVQFGTGFDDLHEVLTEAAHSTDEDARNDLYAEANQLLMQHAPVVPVAWGSSAVAFQSDVEGAHASPLSNEQFSEMSVDRDQLVWMQNAEPGGLYCADETDGEALRACEQVNESLLGYETGGVEPVAKLAEEWESNDDQTEWTFTLRSDVTFHDGSALDANDVVESYRVQWDAADPRHVGREGTFSYWGSLFGGFLNPEEAATAG